MNLFYDYMQEAVDKWSGKVKTKWTPEEGFFDKSSSAIARGLKANSDTLKQAMSRLNFYINRAGKNSTDKDHERLEAVKGKLHKLYGMNESIEVAAVALRSGDKICLLYTSPSPRD